MSDTMTDNDLDAEIGAYADRLFTTGLAAVEAATIALGRELCLYDHLTGAGSTPVELADRAGIHPRYAREWLEQQATAGLITVVDDAGGDADRRRFGLSAAAEECLLRPESLASTGPLFDFVPSIGAIIPALADAFRAGRGVPYADYAIHDAQGDFNRPAFLGLLASEWLPVVPGLVERLQAGSARVAEIGCGEGWAAIGIATAFPTVRVDGFDLDEASIAAARRHATQAGVGDRVRFEVADVTDDRTGDGAGNYDLVLAFEMIHDLAKPREALRTMRRLGKPDAVRVVMDERTNDIFEPNTENPIERLLYAFSVLHCLPVGMVGDDSAGTGTVMRASTLRDYAIDAGFDDVDVLPIEHDLFRFYRLLTR